MYILGKSRNGRMKKRKNGTATGDDKEWSEFVREYVWIMCDIAFDSDVMPEDTSECSNV